MDHIPLALVTPTPHPPNPPSDGLDDQTLPRAASSFRTCEHANTHKRTGCLTPPSWHAPSLSPFPPTCLTSYTMRDVPTNLPHKQNYNNNKKKKKKKNNTNFFTLSTPLAKSQTKEQTLSRTSISVRLVSSRLVSFSPPFIPPPPFIRIPYPLPFLCPRPPSRLV